MIPNDSKKTALWGDFAKSLKGKKMGLFLSFVIKIDQNTDRLYIYVCSAVLAKISEFFSTL